MNLNRLYRKLHKAFVLEATKLETDSVLLRKEFDNIIKNKSIITSVLTEYNFNGKYFDPKFLPVIISMAVEECKRERKEIERQANILADACFKADIQHF